MWEFCLYEFLTGTIICKGCPPKKEYQRNYPAAEDDQQVVEDEPFVVTSWEMASVACLRYLFDS